MSRLSRRMRPVSWLAAVVLIAGVVGVPEAAQAKPKWTPPTPKEVGGVVMTDYKPEPGLPAWSAQAEAAAVRGPAEVVWPSGSAVVDLAPAVTPKNAGKLDGLPATAGDDVERVAAALVAAPGLPVRVGAASPSSAAKAALGIAGPDAAAAPVAPSRVSVAALDRAAVAHSGRNGVLLSLARADGVSAVGAVEVELSYAGFARAYGGDWASRLRLVALPACAAKTPEAAECQTSTPVDFVNHVQSSTLTATVALADAAPVVLAADAGSSGDNGDYAATGLSPASTWQVSTQTGGFSWSVPLRVPPSLGGPSPSLALSYSSQAIDGRTGTSNNQGGWVGDGWEMWPGYIERTYASCYDENPSHKTGDQCWFAENAALTLDGHAGQLIKDGSGVWRLKSDDGTRARLLTDSGRANGDDNNEYWEVTTPNGVKYYFGYHRLPGWETGDPVTNSTWTVPVYGDDSGDPCYDSSFSSAYCTQAWRWNLDYVVDPNNNTMAYFYAKEAGAYGRNNNTDGRTTYDRGGYLDHIDYGMRKGVEYDQAAALRVEFATAERCLSNCWSGAAWTSDPAASAWPDTPWDQYCKSGSSCQDQTSPTFFSARRLTKITTKIRDGATSYVDVESWSLRQEFLNAGQNEGTPMWLRGVTHAGHLTRAGGSAVTDPEIVFDPGAEPLANRVDGPNDGRSALYRWRIKMITTESGQQALISYSPQSDCSRSSLPDPATNTSRCMPAFYAPLGGESTLDWFHKYVVTRIDVDDLVTDQPSTTTFYEYLDGAAWRYNTDELTKDKFRTWGDWRGYSHVRVLQGDPTNSQQTRVEYRYLRGMDGDRLNTSGGTKSVSVANPWGGDAIVDHESLQGFELQKITYDGPGGTEVSSTLNLPWRQGPTATRTRNGVTTEAWIGNTGTARSRAALPGGGFRYSGAKTTYNDLGLPVSVENFGDETVTGDETCSRTTYVRNETIWMIDRVVQQEVLAGTCPAPDAAADPAKVLSRTRTFYDNYVSESSFGAAPTEGNVVRTEKLDGWNGSTPVYVVAGQNTYDDNGRALTATDVLGNTTTTSYDTSTNGGLVTQTVVTNPLGHQTTTITEPAWGLATQTTDPNGLVAYQAYDGVGRLVGVWLPGRAKTATPNMKYTYQVRNDAPSAVTTETLLPTGNNYKKSVQLLDGMLRERQSQVQAPDGGRVVTDTFHNTLGTVEWASAAYYDSTNTAPGTTLAVPQGTIPSVTEHVYDGAGRETASILYANGVEKWRNSTVYGGDRSHTIPPAGGVATTTISDVFGNTVEQRQYHDGAQVGSIDPAAYDATRYEYNLTGALTKVTDAAGSVWRYTYDLRGRQISAVDPDKGTTITTYDAAGNVVTATSPLGSGTATLAYTYDALGRKTSLRDNSPTGPKRAEWVYDTVTGGKGRLAKSIRWVGSAAYQTRVNAYDTAGRATSTTLAIPSTEGKLCAASGTRKCEYTTTVTYRADGSINDTTVPAVADLTSETLAFGYNDIGLPTTMLSSSQIYLYSVTYDKIGELTQQVLGNNGSRVAVTSVYDEPTRRLANTNVVPELMDEVADWSYTYDDTGNVTKIVEAPAGQTADTQCFGHDYLGRLTSAWTPGNGSCGTPSAGSLGGPAPYWHSWTYDLSGNRTSEVRHAAAGNTIDTYTYPAAGEAAVRPHAVNQVSTTAPGSNRTSSYTYDNAGNTATRPSAAGNQQALAFDAEGRLATLTEAGKTTSYVYDANGGRLIRRDSTGVTLYLPDGAEVRLATGAASAKATRYYSHEGTTIAVRSAEGLFWIVGDHHGTAEVTLNSSTLAVSKRRSLPFGAERGSNSGWPNALDKGFVGGTKDPTGLVHLGAREYDPLLGRFISVDPVMNLKDPNGWNGYAYANNSPATLSDPSGLAPICGDDVYARACRGNEAPLAKYQAPRQTLTPCMYGGPCGPRPTYPPPPPPQPKPWYQQAWDKGGEWLDKGADWVENTAVPWVTDTAVPWVNDEVFGRVGTAATYWWDTSVRRATNPGQTLWDTVTLTAFAEDLSALVAIGEGATLYREGDYCGKDASCFVGGWVPGGADAITAGHTVVFSSDLAPGDKLVAHEMQHVYDVEATGGWPFYLSYVTDIGVGMASGKSKDEAYDGAFWEKKAYAVSDNYYTNNARPSQWSFFTWW